jgi:hypothetical protein
VSDGAAGGGRIVGDDHLEAATISGLRIAARALAPRRTCSSMRGTASTGIMFRITPSPSAPQARAWAA